MQITRINNSQTFNGSFINNSLYEKAIAKSYSADKLEILKNRMKHYQDGCNYYIEERTANCGKLKENRYFLTRSKDKNFLRKGEKSIVRYNVGGSGLDLSMDKKLVGVIDDCIKILVQKYPF